MAVGDLSNGVCDSSGPSWLEEFGSDYFSFIVCASLGFIYLSEIRTRIMPSGNLNFVKFVK